MNDEDLLTQLPQGHALLLPSHPPAYAPVHAFEIPVFFEPLDAEAIAQAGAHAHLVAVVLDGDRPLGRDWIAKIRAWAHMVPGNTAHFGQSPYYYGFRHACPRSPRDDDRLRSSTFELQYLVFVQGPPDPASRRRIAMAMLRQWQAEGTPSHNLACIRPEFFAGAPAMLLRLPQTQTAMPGERAAPSEPAP